MKRVFARTWRLLPRDAMARVIAQLAPRAVMQDKRYLDLWQPRGFHVTPVHFNEPIPDTRELSDEIWANHHLGVGLDFNDSGQQELLTAFCARYRKEWEAFPNKTDGPQTFFYDQGAFRSVDAEILYAMIRHFKPRRVVEIGSGMSTLLSAAAIRQNRALDQVDCTLICVEPHPPQYLRNGISGIPQFSLLAVPVQSVSLAVFESLEANDVLFIDSSHVLKIGSDVQFEYLQVLPRLKPGVVVHVHDIFLPAEYQRRWIKEEHLFWNEQYLLHAFLQFNSAFKVLWAGSYMHLKYPDLLTTAFKSYDREKEWPGSFWMQRVPSNSGRSGDAACPYVAPST
jgi:predicted O-methyltransferase YrrM